MPRVWVDDRSTHVQFQAVRDLELRGLPVENDLLTITSA